MVSVIVLAAGQGKRMNSDLPKVLHPVGGKLMIHHVLDTALSLQTSDSANQTVVVISPTLNEKIVKGDRSVSIATQSKPLGTGDAVKAGLDALTNIPKTVLVLCGDTPLLETEALATIIAQHHENSKPSITVVGMRPHDPRRYGRILVDDSGQISRIVEYRDATEDERAITLCNSGVILADGALLKRLIMKLTPQNDAGEYYLTDIVALAKQEGIESRVAEMPYEPLQGINTRIDLAAAEAALQWRWRHAFMEKGVTLIDPNSVFFCHDTQIDQDVTIYPNVTFGSSVKIGKGVVILPNCHIEKSKIGNDVTIGPFAHLREGVELGDNVAIGNFVELKTTIMGAHTKAKHLSYLGNATIGENVNIGAGTITCNHNGFVKSQTNIGDQAYIGSNSCLVAPVSVGAGAIVAAGSVVNTNVPEDALAIARERQENKLKWAAEFRARFKK
jgi:bifunctional UDP-N-acetylglucosamine pyrophosphorylase / glucosamine-1-phosphate N-acetyltransferase